MSFGPRRTTNENAAGYFERLTSAEHGSVLKRQEQGAALLDAEYKTDTPRGFTGNVWATSTPWWELGSGRERTTLRGRVANRGISPSEIRCARKVGGPLNLREAPSNGMR